MHEENCFVTLTYNDSNLPSDYGLDIADWQQFARKLRKYLAKLNPPRKFRYFHCGEYGETYERPHYHACLFGVDFNEDRVKWTEKHGHTLYRSETLEKIWNLGHSLIGEVTFESAAYCARYIMKKVTGDRAESHYSGRKPEYTTMSRRPGLGSTWYDAFNKEVYNSDSVVINKKEARPPKFYDGRFEIDHPEEMIEIKQQRVKKAAKHTNNNTPERLKVREEVQRRKIQIHKRNIDDTH